MFFCCCYFFFGWGRGSKFVFIDVIMSRCCNNIPLFLIFELVSEMLTDNMQVFRLKVGCAENCILKCYSLSPQNSLKRFLNLVHVATCYAHNMYAELFSCFLLFCGSNVIFMIFRGKCLQEVMHQSFVTTAPPTG